MIEWRQISGMRHAEYCDVNRRRVVVEAAHFGTAPYGDLHFHPQFNGFISGVRVGTWDDLDEAKRETVLIAERR